MLGRLSLVFFLLALLAPPATSWAQSEDVAGKRYFLGAEMCSGLFLTPVLLERDNGRSEEERTLWFLYDTGASSSFVDPDSIFRATGVTVKEGARANIRNASSGPLTYNKLPARVLNLDHLSLALGRRVDGILGVNTYKKFLVTLDYEHQELVLTEGALPPPDGKTILSTKGRDKRPWITIKIGDRKRRILLDSGSSGGFALNKIARLPVAADPVFVSASMRLKKVEARLGSRLTKDVAFGQFTVKTPVIGQAQRTELFGARIMENYEWTFDLKGRRVQIMPGREGEVTTPAIYGLGLGLNTLGGAMKVVHVAKGGVADSVGVAIGDEIVDIDGVRVAERGCSQSDDYSEKTYGVSRKGERLEFSMQPEVIVP